MEKLTNKQHTDYCEILNDFRCKAIDIIEELTKEYKNTLAEDIDSKLNDYHTHNEKLICELWEARQENTILKKALELACQELPIKSEYCSNHPERYNLQDEYGSDEPYWVEDGGCEFDSPENCLCCVKNYFIEQAKESMK